MGWRDNFVAGEDKIIVELDASIKAGQLDENPKEKKAAEQHLAWLKANRERVAKGENSQGFWNGSKAYIVKIRDWAFNVGKSVWDTGWRVVRLFWGGMQAAFTLITKLCNELLMIVGRFVDALAGDYKKGPAFRISVQFVTQDDVDAATA